MSTYSPPHQRQSISIFLANAQCPALLQRSWVIWSSSYQRILHHKVITPHLCILQSVSSTMAKIFICVRGKFMACIPMRVRQLFFFETPTKQTAAPVWLHLSEMEDGGYMRPPSSSPNDDEDDQSGTSHSAIANPRPDVQARALSLGIWRPWGVALSLRFADVLEVIFFACLIHNHKSIPLLLYCALQILTSAFTWPDFLRMIVNGL